MPAKQKKPPKPAEGPRVQAPHLLDFVAYLDEKLARDPPKQKGLRTRERLKIAAARLLEEKGYHALRVGDVTRAANVAEGSFYLYFKDKTDIALHVLTQMLEEAFDLDDAEAPSDGMPFDTISAANRRWLALCRANPGLLRCVFQLSDEFSEFARLSQRVNRAWYERVAQGVVRRHAKGALKMETAMLAVYFLGAMMDEIVRKLIVYPDPEFLAVLSAQSMGDDELADAASLIWLRVLYPNMPVTRRTAKSVDALKKMLEGSA